MEKFKKARLGGEFKGFTVFSRVSTFDKKHTLLSVPMDSFDGSTVLQAVNGLNRILRERVRGEDLTHSVRFTKANLFVVAKVNGRNRNVNIKTFEDTMTILIDKEVT